MPIFAAAKRLSRKPGLTSSWQVCAAIADLIARGSSDLLSDEQVGVIPVQRSGDLASCWRRLELLPARGRREHVLRLRSGLLGSGQGF